MSQEEWAKAMSEEECKRLAQAVADQIIKSAPGLAVMVYVGSAGGGKTDGAISSNIKDLRKFLRSLAGRV